MGGVECENLLPVLGWLRPARSGRCDRLDIRSRLRQHRSPGRSRVGRPGGISYCRVDRGEGELGSSRTAHIDDSRNDGGFSRRSFGSGEHTIQSNWTSLEYAVVRSRCGSGKSRVSITFSHLTLRTLSLDDSFRKAVAAIDAGDINSVEQLITAAPALVRERLDSPGPWLRDKVGKAVDGFFQRQIGRAHV